MPLPPGLRGRFALRVEPRLQPQVRPPYEERIRASSWPRNAGGGSQFCVLLVQGKGKGMTRPATRRLSLFACCRQLTKTRSKERKKKKRRRLWSATKEVRAATNIEHQGPAPRLDADKRAADVALGGVPELDSFDPRVLAGSWRRATILGGVRLSGLDNVIHGSMCFAGPAH